MNYDVNHLRCGDEYFFQEGCFILELENNPAYPDVSIARARVLPGVTTRLHQLRGVTERYVILEGQGEVFLGGESPTAVQIGTVVRIAADCTQKIKNTGQSDLIFLAICTPRFTTECYLDAEDSPRHS